MSNNVILDASALLVLLKNEPGADMIEPLLGRIIMSSISVSEVAASLLNSDMTLQECQEAILPFISTIVPFNEEQAFLAAELKKQIKDYDLSLADRACLALESWSNWRGGRAQGRLLRGPQTPPNCCCRGICAPGAAITSR